MALKDLPRSLQIGMLVGALVIGYLFWANCIAPLKSFTEKNEAADRLTGPTVKAARGGAAYLRFHDWDIQTVPGRSQTMPVIARAKEPLLIRASLFPKDGVAVRYIDLIFPINTSVSSRSRDGRSWLSIGRADANACRYLPASDEAEASEIRLPDIEVTFRSAGIFEVVYSIMFQDYRTIDGKCVFTAAEE